MRTLLILCAAWLCAAHVLRAEDTTWTSYGGGHNSWRYSELSEINTSNVATLAPQWVFQTNTTRLQTVPLVMGGLMYATGSSNEAFALDLLTGQQVWRYSKPLPEGTMGCCGTPNRGFAVSGDRLFKVNYEGTLVALDAKSGARLWETEAADYRKGFSLTVAPQVVNDKVIIGNAGAEFGTRGFIDAYSAATGERLWRFHTTAGPEDPEAMATWSGDSWKRGGGSAWVTGSYDPELNTIYWGTGNPGPDMVGEVREGDNLYTCSLVALDPDTGKLKWHYQFTPHDVHDYDAAEDLPLVDLEIGGRKVKAVIQANRNGQFYALDRTNGELLVAKPYTTVTWMTGMDATGRPIVPPNIEPTEDGNIACPGLPGGHNWWPTTYSPAAGLYFFSSRDGCQVFRRRFADYVEGQWYQLGNGRDIPGQRAVASTIAVDPATGEIKWRHEMSQPPVGGFLSTAGNLLFVGDRDGYFIAFDANTGKVLWKFQTGGQSITAGAVSYRFRGKQYVAVAAGGNIMAFALP
jgi:alcohol dehydrogenase (cytochrome c)